MPNITNYVPKELYEVYMDDGTRLGLVAKLLAEYYGLQINKTRVVKKPTT